MKKSLLLALAAVAALGAQAIQVETLNAPMKRQNVTLSQRAALTNSTLGTMLKAHKVAPKDDEAPITEAPAGTEFKNLYVEGDSYGLGWGSVYHQIVDGGIADVVVGEDGNLYIRGPISQAYVWALGSPYIKCTPNEDGTYTMATPQPYAIDAGDLYYIQRLKGSEGAYEVDAENTTIRFSWENGVLTQLDDCYFGLTDATGDWFYMADGNVKMSVNTDKVTTVPFGWEETILQMTYNDKPDDLTSRGKKMISGWTDESEGEDADENTSYLTYLEKNLPNSAIKMTIDENDNITLASGQYMGVDEEYNSHVYLLTGNTRIDTSGSTSYFNYDKTDFLPFEKNEETKTFTTTYPGSLIINTGRNNLYIIDEFVAPELSPVDDEPLTPANPEFGNVTESTRFDVLRFTIPTVSTDGKDLNTNFLSYVIYKDGAVYTFTPELFEGLSEEMTVIPYAFGDSNYDIYLGSNGHTIYFYSNDYQQVGIQSVYTGGGEEHRSDIAYYTRSTSGIDDVKVAAGKVTKLIEDGQVIIVKDGVRYNAMGQLIK